MFCFPLESLGVGVHFLILTFPTFVKAAALRSFLQCCVFGPSVNPGEENSQDLHCHFEQNRSTCHGPNKRTSSVISEYASILPTPGSVW